MSLRQVIELGKQNKPWVFAPIAHPAIAQSGYDPELWFLLADNLASLGLRTLAAAQLDGLCQRRPTAADTPVVRDLRQRIESLPDDRVPHEELIANAKLAARALKERGIDIAGELEAWTQTLSSTESFRATDGNIVRLAGDQIVHFGDQIGAAREIGEQNIANVAGSPAPFTIEGVDPPWLLIELDRQTPWDTAGYQPGIRVVQADVNEFLDGCSMVDISEILTQPRIELFLGAGAAEKLEQALANDAGTPVAGPYMPLRSLRTPISPATADLMRSAMALQDAEHSEHLKQIHRRDADRDESWWRRRLTEAIVGDAEPLRVMITTCRFTTVLYSMCVDLAESLRRQGCEVELLTEPSEHRRLSPLGYSRVLDTFDPDVILAPNYTRRDLEKVITGSHTPSAESRVLPVGVPFVVWVQDAMPHLLTTEAGASIGPLDVAFGYISHQMSRDFGYPADAIEQAQLASSTTRFSPDAVNADLKREYACDVALMTHHSETPEAMTDRLLDEIGKAGPMRRLAESMLPGIRNIAQNPMIKGGLYGAARELIDQQQDLDAASREQLLQNYVLRIVDRMLRHETAHWASEICKERGWSFKIFGRGWEDHPTLSEHAMSELSHGGALASAYSAAGVTLQISAFNPFHQRIIECALSGGCPIVRRIPEIYSLSILQTQQRIAETLKPQNITNPADGFGRVLWFDCMQSCDTARLTLMYQLAGKEIDGSIPIRDPKTDPRINTRLQAQPNADPAWLLGDVREMTYDSKKSLESSIELAHNHPSWRAAAGGGIANRALTHFTHDAISTKLLNKLHQRATQQSAG